MEQVINIISSLSVLVAAWAGLIAISKWKAERFEKIKIEKLEKYENILFSVIEKVDEIVYSSGFRGEAFQGESYSFSNNNQDLIFFNNNCEKVEELNSLIKDLFLPAREYASSSGVRLMFNFYFYNSFPSLMFNCLHLINAENAYNERSEGNFEAFMLDYISNNKDSFTDIADFAMIYTPPAFKLNNAYSSLGVNDFRNAIDSKFFDMVRLEKLYLHSSFFKKMLITVRLFFLRYELIGKTYLASDRVIYYIGRDGGLVRKSFDGKSYKEIEAIMRKGLFRIYLTHTVKRFFYL